MNIDRPKLFTVMLLGATLSSLFFYPLFSELHGNILYLQWRRINTVELFCAFFLFSLLAAIAFCLMYKCKNVYIKLLILSVVAFIPFMSFFVYFLKQTLGAGFIVTVSNLILNQYRMISLSLIPILAAGIVFILVRYPRRILQIIILTIFILSPINISSIWNAVKAYSNDAVIYIDNCKNSRSPSHHKPDSNILVVLFDELSYDYLYEHDKIKRQYQNIRSLSLVSDNYHRAVSPGNETLTAIPGLIMGERFERVEMKYDQIYKITKNDKFELLTINSNNLFAYAKDAGYKTFCFGPYLNHCELFGKWLDGCRSFSIYNYGGLCKEFKLYNPILTTIVLLPHQFPYGFLKNPVYSLWQKSVMEQSYALTMRAINDSEPFFIFTHFYPAHLPFTFDKNGYYKNSSPFLSNHENYSRQLDYVDRSLGNLIAELKRNGKFNNTTIVLLSDHNYRVMFAGRERVVPLIIKHKNQEASKDIYSSVKTEEVLRKELFGL